MSTHESNRKMWLGHSLEWWLWLSSALALDIGLFFHPAGLAAAILIAGVQVLLIARLRGGVYSVPSQVRIANLGLLLLGMWEPMASIHWMLLAGTWAVVITGYCFLARALSLLPTHHNQPLSLQMVTERLFSQPDDGSVVGCMD